MTLEVTFKQNYSIICFHSLLILVKKFFNLIFYIEN